MNDRTLYGPDGPEFRAWMQRNDPDACMKREAAIVAARLDEMLQESIHISPLEVMLLATFSEDAKAKQVEEENRIAAEINAAVAKRNAITEQKRKEGIATIKYGLLCTAGWIVLLWVAFEVAQ